MIPMVQLYFRCLDSHVSDTIVRKNHSFHVVTTIIVDASSPQRISLPMPAQTIFNKDVSPYIYIFYVERPSDFFFINERSSATGFVLSFRLPRYRSRHFDTLDGSYWRKVGSEDVISWCWCGRDKEKRNVCCDEDCMGTYLRVEIDSCFVCTLVCIAVRSKVSMSIYLLSSIVIIKGASKLSQSIF